MTKTDHTITFREITKETLHDILRLQVTPHQQQFVASNTMSLVEAHFEPDLPWFRGIYAGDTPVGFLILGDNKEDATYTL